MKTPPSRIASMVLVTAMGYGCTITIGGGSTSNDDNNSVVAGEVPRLPDPSVWRVEASPLTSEQQQRKEEVDQFLAEQYLDYRIVEATQGYSGDIIYWVDSDTIPGPYLTPPPPRWTQEDLTPPSGTELARTELELYPELRGPEGATPIHRPDFSTYVMGLSSASSLQDYVENYQLPGQPSGKNRLYSGLRSILLNTGASGNINQFQGDVEQGTFSLIEIAVACQGLDPIRTLEQVGAVVSRDRANFFNSEPRIHVEYMTQGPGGMGPRKGGWDERTAGFIPWRGRLYGPNAVVPASSPGLGKQQEHRFDIDQDDSGNWWIAHNGNTLGYYPANMFDMLNWAACEVAWYGEVYDPTPGDWTWTDMGSSEFPNAGYGYAAYVRNPGLRDLASAPWVPVDDPKSFEDVTDLSCYQRSALLETSEDLWRRFFYLGGPGGDAPGCD